MSFIETAQVSRKQATGIMRLSEDRNEASDAAGILQVMCMQLLDWVDSYGSRKEAENPPKNSPLLERGSIRTKWDILSTRSEVSD